jgi:small ligand-binding sensory domain FIST
MNTPTDADTNTNAYSELVLGTYDESEVKAAAARALKQIGGNASIAFVFVSCDYREALPDLVELVQIHAHCPKVVGCSGAGIIGTGREEEGESGFTLLVLKLPQAEASTFTLRDEDTHSPSWKQAKSWNDQGCTGWIVLGNPAEIGEDWMDLWNETMGTTPTYGGLASGSRRAEDLFLFTEKGVTQATALAIGFRGGVKLSGLVSQGCTPIGEPLTITKAEDNMIYKIASLNAYDQLQSAFQTLSMPMRERAQGNILVGLAMTEYVEDFHSGDFLIRSILGGDPAAGTLAVGANPRIGQTVQFQLRDREAADAELRSLLERKRADLAKPPFASLLFSCGGRGQQLFGQQHHDAGLFEGAFGSVPMSGFFCNGEIGTVGDKSYLHGFTASGVLFVECAP